MIRGSAMNLIALLQRKLRQIDPALPYPKNLMINAFLFCIRDFLVIITLYIFSTGLLKLLVMLFEKIAF
jgi:hypothetical protein